MKMRAFIAAALLGSVFANPAHAAITARFAIKGYVTVERTITFNAPQSQFPKYCDPAYLPSNCIWVEMLKIKLDRFDYVEGSSVDGINFDFGGSIPENRSIFIYGSAIYVGEGVYRGVKLEYFDIDSRPEVDFDATGGELLGFDVGTTTRFDIYQVDPAPVPEPASWALLILGFGAAGAAMRSDRRRRPLLLPAQLKT